jgi:hypothetical protein
MSLLDKAKDAAKTVGEKAKQGVEVGREKVDAVAAKRKVDELKEELGGIVYLQRTGAPPENAEAEISRIISAISEAEAKAAE